MFQSKTKEKLQSHSSNFQTKVLDKEFLSLFPRRFWCAEDQPFEEACGMWSTPGSDEHIITSNFTQGRPALSLSHSLAFLSVRPSDMENCPCVSAHRSEASVLACNKFSCIKTGLIELSKAFWWRSAFASGKITSWLLTLWPTGWGKSIQTYQEEKLSF